MVRMLRCRSTGCMRSNLAAVVLFCAAATAAQEKPVPAAAPAAPPAEAAKAEYVGNDPCAACHDEIVTAFQKTRHRAIEKETKRGWEGRSCESCHGPGSKHAESTDIAEIVNPAKIPAPRENATCLGCHVNQAARTGRIAAGHANNQIACGSCHTIHPKPGKTLVERRRPAVNAQCAGCHQNAWAAFQRPHTHPLAQGAMSCTDCHNPHSAGVLAARRVSYGNEPSCLACHSNLRGPFVFEHAPVRLEGCSSCHVPHGSANPKMLTRGEVRTVCLECHADVNAVTGAGSNALGAVPPAFHDIRSPRIQACSTCHRKIHGSYVDRSLQR